MLVEFKQDVTSEQQGEVSDQARAMLSEIPVVEEIYIGPKARQNRAVHIKNYDVAIYIRLQHEDDIDAYRSHPLHRRFLQQNKHKFAWIQVVDFVATGYAEPVAEVAEPKPVTAPPAPELQTSTERLNP